jgi:hypothetical protein
MGESKQRKDARKRRGEQGFGPGYTIGITIFVKADGDMALFENGLRQNVLFLYLLFKNSPNCRRVYLLNHGDGDAPLIPERLGIPADAVVRTRDVIDQLDYVIGAGAAMDAETVAALRQRGCKLICYKGGNGGVISIEATAAKPQRPDAELYFDRDYWDVIWMTPQHIHTYRGWCETIYRCPVQETPQIWAPLMIQSADAPVRDDFGYRRKAGEPWRIGIMDPNITVMKTSHLPMLVCETAFRRRREAFRAIYVTNALPYKEDDHFRSFAVSLEASKAGVMTVEQRFVSSHFLTNHADAVVTHHWENGLNYLYYEVLWGGYPLVHNSEFLKDYGYYYETFDADSGADALLRAFDEHDANLDAYKARNAPLMKRLDPANPETITLHEGLLAAIAAR